MTSIIPFDELKNRLTLIKTNDVPLVFVGGCFDILHLGHVRFLKEAKKYGVVLVALESDTTLRKQKGTARPIHTQLERAEVLASLETVDYVLLLPPLSTDKDYFNLTKVVKPEVIALTEGDPQLANKQSQAQEVGAQVIIVPKITTPSTTQLAKLLNIV